jgi:hypothetical protein
MIFWQTCLVFKIFSGQTGQQASFGTVTQISRIIQHYDFASQLNKTVFSCTKKNLTSISDSKPRPLRISAQYPESAIPTRNKNYDCFYCALE